MNLNLRGFILSEDKIKYLINNCNSPKLAEAINLAYYDGFKLNFIIDKIKINRRTLQYQLSKLGKDLFGLTISFEKIRHSCIIRLLNQGYTFEYIQKFMGYSEGSDIIKYKRRLAGYISLKKRLAIFKRDNFKCCYCGSNKQLTIDHICPITKGGKSATSNLQTLCDKCNAGKKDA